MNSQRDTKSLTLNHPAETSMPIVLLDWRPLRKNSLQGFCKILIGRSLMVSDVTINTSHGRTWASLPAKPIVRDGQHALDPKTGKPAWTPVLEWASDTARRRFSDSVIRALLETHPSALDDAR
jgi:hypothetical protein